MTTLRKIAAGQYETTDGRYKIEADDNPLPGACECFICQNGWPECPHGGVGNEHGWLIWDDYVGDYLAGTGPLEFKTKRDAVAYLNRHLAKEAQR